MSVDTLIDSVWGERAPASARHMVHEYVSRLRGALGEAPVIVTRAPGYIVERDACDVDAARFIERLNAARAAVAADELDEALKAFDEALGLWRGDALSDVALEADARFAAARLDDERRTARSERVDIALDLGRHHELIPGLERAVAAEPHDERVLRQLMLALYRDGRQADALARYRDGRQRLAGDLGIEPGVDLRALEQAILQHDPGLAAPVREPTAAAPGPPGPPPRRPRLALGVTVVIVASAATAIIAMAFGGAHRGRPRRSTAMPSPWWTRHPRISSTRWPWIRDRDRSRTAPDRSGSRIPTLAPSHGSRRRPGGSWPGSCSTAAQGLAATSGSLWAVGSSPTDSSLTLDRIDPTFNTAARVRRLPMVVLGDGGSIAAGRDSVVVAPRAGYLTRIDARSGRMGRIDPTVAPAAVAQGFGSSWLVDREENLVVRVDSSGAITPIPVGRGPSAIAVGKRAVWVADALDGTVSSIDPATYSSDPATGSGS